MSPPDFFYDWVERYRMAFGLVQEHWGESMILWWQGFAPLSYTAAELNEATRRCLTMTPAPRFPADHLDAIKNAVAEQRVERRREFTDQARYESPGVQCPDCCDSGMIFVPHLADCDLVEHQWLPYYAKGGEVRREIPVTCHCRKGVETYNTIAGYATMKGKPNPMSLASYERRVPRWRKMLADWREVRRAETLAAFERWKRDDQGGWLSVVDRMIQAAKLRHDEGENSL